MDQYAYGDPEVGLYTVNGVELKLADVVMSSTRSVNLEGGEEAEWDEDVDLLFDTV
jgi:hypothetical protein